MPSMPLYPHFCLGGGNLDADYVPASLKDNNGNRLYRFGVIETLSFTSDKAPGYYSSWVPLIYDFCNQSRNRSQLVLESWSPSAMVDMSGVLFTLSLYTFYSSGPTF